MGFTVRPILNWFVKLPVEPVTVTVTVPIAAVPVAVNVSALVLVVLLGLKEVVTPLGRPDTEKVTFPVKPLMEVMVMVLVPLEPCVIIRLPGVAWREKFGPKTGQWFTRLAALTVPIPVAKSQPMLVPYAGLKELSDVESTPTEPPAR